ncbi:MAG: glycosyl hydrolase-related protein [Culicoidibacterales bacterium]
MKIKKVLILNHTHWDREWYETFEQFRYKLATGLRHVIEQIAAGEVESFFLDGQTVVVEDFKEIVSDDVFARFLEQIKAGKIEIGPWYLLADEFLVSGESLIKNLFYGRKIAKEYGSNDDIAYLPDTFGHISQIPQIFKLNGIKNGLIWRGTDTKTDENTWVGADLSCLNTVVLPLFEGYYQTYLMAEDIVEKVGEYLSRSEQFILGDVLLLMNGADHTIIIDDLKAKITELQNAYPDIIFAQTTMANFTNQLGKKTAQQPKISGQQRDCNKIFLLPGVLSTRTYLKVQNQESEDLATHTLGTLGVFAADFDQEEQFRSYLWKLVLKNQPHDSICGCSIDEVHQEMEVRSQKIKTAIEQYRETTLNRLYPYTFGPTAKFNHLIYAHHLLPEVVNKVVKMTIFTEIKEEKGSLTLADQNGAKIPLQIISRTEKEGLFRGIFQEPQYAHTFEYVVAFYDQFTGIESRKYQISLTDLAEEVVAAEQVITNEFYKISVENGALVIENQETGVKYLNQHQLEASLDAGDTYNYSPPVNNQVNVAKLVAVENGVYGSLVQSLVLKYQLTTPTQLTEDRLSGSQELITSYYTTEITLERGDSVIGFKTRVDNFAKDQKVTINFFVENVDYAYADTAFDVIKTSPLAEITFDAAKNKEVRSNTAATQSFVAVNKHMFVHRGLQEYELEKATNKLKITLLRCVGDLSRRDLRTRGNGAGPSFPTPDAQCLGKRDFTYGLSLVQKDISPALAKEFRIPVITQQSSTETSTKQILVQEKQTVTFSTLEQASQNSYCLRFYNHTENVAQETIRLGISVKAINEVDLQGNCLRKHDTWEPLNLVFKPKEIKTILLVI